jgi:hypothetical protein
MRSEIACIVRRRTYISSVLLRYSQILEFVFLFLELFPLDCDLFISLSPLVIHAVCSLLRILTLFTVCEPLVLQLSDSLRLEWMILFEILIKLAFFLYFIPLIQLMVLMKPMECIIHF